MTKTALYFFLAVTILGFVLISNFTLNLSPSLPIGLYHPTHEPLSRGALVLLRAPLKQLVGVPGDTIRTSPEGTYLNGRLIPNSGIPSGSPYRPYPFTTFKLDPYQYWTLGTNPLSWDSRYVGPIPATLIASTVIPVWIEGAIKK